MVKWGFLIISIVISWLSFWILILYIVKWGFGLSVFPISQFTFVSTTPTVDGFRLPEASLIFGQSLGSYQCKMLTWEGEPSCPIIYILGCFKTYTHNSLEISAQYSAQASKKSRLRFVSGFLGVEETNIPVTNGFLLVLAVVSGWPLAGTMLYMVTLLSFLHIWTGVVFLGGGNLILIDLRKKIHFIYLPNKYQTIQYNNYHTIHCTKVFLLTIHDSAISWQLPVSLERKH